MNPAKPAEPNSAHVPRFDLELGPTPDGSAFASYRQSTETLYRVALREPWTEATFFARAVHYQLPHAAAARITSVAQRLQRGPQEIAGGSDAILIYAQVSGEVEATIDGQTRTMRPGDVTLFDHTREITSLATDFINMYLTIARTRVPPALLIPAYHGKVLAAATAGARLVYRSIETFLDTADGLTLGEADAAVDAILTVAAGALQASTAAEDARLATASEGMLQRAMAAIDRNVADPALSPALLEESLGLSRSSLYRLLEPHGGVRAVILRRRLDRAMKALLTGVLAKPPLREIARETGFSSEAHLARAFRTRFKLTPGQFYDLVRAKDYAALTRQAELAGFGNLQTWLDRLSGPATP
jgi:AraC-like DNA-binding protein